MKTLALFLSLLATGAMAKEGRTYEWAGTQTCGHTLRSTYMKYERPSPELVLIIQEQCRFRGVWQVQTLVDDEWKGFINWDNREDAEKTAADLIKYGNFVTRIIRLREDE